MRETLPSALEKGKGRPQESYTKATVTLDPDTANPYLVLSAVWRSVRREGTHQHLPYIPKRFDIYSCVLGHEGFTWGRHCWEVEELPWCEMPSVPTSPSRCSRQHQAGLSWLSMTLEELRAATGTDPWGRRQLCGHYPLQCQQPRTGAQGQVPLGALCPEPGWGWGCGWGAAWSGA
ncbi:butyrophilin subfamily 3 member A3 [Alligator mississippiensis]|uniref:butyrophilin subfamily 3 member A3 n=1 Tax=Alligator mississippiensis TaxID=8496 RepID=UPI002877C3BC|nr:butyrophilin subfamily 3 member A3 [Alligator mississippiensis]